MAGLKLSFIIEAIDRATAPVRKVNQAIERVTEPVRRVRAAVNSLARESGLPKLGADVHEVGTRFNNLTGSVRGVVGALGLATAATVAAVYPLKRVIDEAGQLNDTAATLGMNARDLQRLSFALTLDGSSMQDASNSLRFLQRNAVEALTGSKEMSVWFRRAGMSSAFLKKNLKDPQALLYGLADALKKNQSPAQRLALTQALLSKGGPKVVQTLARGSQALKELGDEAEALGAVLDDKTVVAMDDAGDAITKAERAVGGLFAVVTAAALPVVMDITARTISWAQANRGLIATRAGEFFAQLQQRLPAILDGIGEAASATSTFLGVVNSMAQAIGGWNNVAALLATILVGKVVIAVALLGKAFLALGVTMLTTPIGWFLIAVAQIAAVAYLIYRNWEPIKAFFVNLWDGVKQAFTAAYDWIGERITAVTSVVKNAIVSLDAMMPDWVKRWTLPGAALNVAANAITQQTALPAPGARNTEVGGKLTIAIDQEGRARVREMRSANPNVDFEVENGPIMVMP